MKLTNLFSVVLFEAAVDTIKELVEQAVRNGADLRRVNLEGADLRGAELWGANLWGANLEGADLRDADLEGADLRNADLEGADLRGAKFVPTSVLLAWWGEVSDNLCTELMRLDAFAHPSPKVFDIWAQGGACPYIDLHILRIVNFQEKRELWIPGQPRPIYSLMIQLFQEKNIKF